MNILDNLENIRELDPGGMYDAIVDFPNQIREAIKIWEQTKIDPEAFPDMDKIDNIVICGMGGSAIGGDLAGAVLEEYPRIPIIVSRDYSLPYFARDKTVVIVSSYSGNTEETLMAMYQAVSRKCKIFAITTGGAIGEFAIKKKIPILSPKKGLQPRAALGYSFGLLMMLLYNLGVSHHLPRHLDNLASYLDIKAQSFLKDKVAEKNRCKQLAEKLHNRIPIIYSNTSFTSPAAIRFKGQLSENAKVLSFVNQFPECNHNEIVGWKNIELLKDKVIVILLRDRSDYTSSDELISSRIMIKARMNIVKEMIEAKGVEVIEINSGGDDELQRLFSIVQIADFTSFYLAILNDEDPTPVSLIEELKQRLSELD
ncbi:MAG: bifunctional phosphoglucose/phosphomannose isomerase [candidate division Zixibacteria bacterium]